MKTNLPSEELRLLKRSIHGSGLLGVVLPIFAAFVLKEESKTAVAVGFALLVFAAIHLSYLRRLEKKLNTQTEQGTSEVGAHL